MTPRVIQAVFQEPRKCSSQNGPPLHLTACRAYNDRLYLCEKYAPLESLERYRPENDVSVTGAYVQHETHMMKDAHLNQTTMSSASQSIHT